MSKMYDPLPVLEGAMRNPLPWLETMGNVVSTWLAKMTNSTKDERKSEQAHIPHARTLLENAVYNEWQFQALGTGNRTKKGI